MSAAQVESRAASGTGKPESWHSGRIPPTLQTSALCPGGATLLAATARCPPARRITRPPASSLGIWLPPAGLWVPGTFRSPAPLQRQAPDFAGQSGFTGCSQRPRTGADGE